MLCSFDHNLPYTGIFRKPKLAYLSGGIAKTENPHGLSFAGKRGYSEKGISGAKQITVMRYHNVLQGISAAAHLCCAFSTGARCIPIPPATLNTEMAFSIPDNILLGIMAVFECNRCGKCCTSLGPHITIQRQLNERDYYCRSTVDNAVFLARIDPEFREEIADEFAGVELDRNTPDNKSCTFLRRNPDGGGMACAIYATRPKVCRDFRCYRMLIRTRDGKVSGKVIGKNTIRTEDAALESLWNEQVAAIPYSDTVAWIKKVTAVLEVQGYRADPVE